MRIWLLFLFLVFSTLTYAGSIPTFYGPLKQVSINNANIAFYRFGKGKPLVMVTGHGDNMLMWHPDFLKKMSQNHEVIIFDYPGIGKSTIHGNFPNTMEELSQLVRSFINSQHIIKPDILGFSMGGSLVLYMATQNSDDYNHVIVIGAKAGGKKTIVPEPRYFNMLSDTSISPAVAIKTLLFPTSAAKEADAYLKIIANLPPEKMDGNALKAQSAAVNGENNGSGIWDELPNIKNKTLVLNGTEDVLTPVQNAVMIAASIKGAWLVQITGAGHGVLFQEPEYISDLVTLFLNS